MESLYGDYARWVLFQGTLPVPGEILRDPLTGEEVNFSPWVDGKLNLGRYPGSINYKIPPAAIVPFEELVLAKPATLEVEMLSASGQLLLEISKIERNME